MRTIKTYSRFRQFLRIALALFLPAANFHTVFALPAKDCL